VHVVVLASLLPACAPVKQDAGGGAESPAGRARLIQDIRTLDAMAQARDRPYRWLEELARITPPEVMLLSMVEQGNRIDLEGIALSNARISGLMRAIDQSVVFAEPDLKVIQVSNHAGTRRSRFEMSLREYRLPPIALGGLSLDDPDVPLEQLVERRDNDDLLQGAVRATARKRLRELAGLAQHAGAQLALRRAQVVGDIHTRTKRYDKLACPVTVSGSYPALRRFFSDLNTRHLPIAWEGIALRSVAGTEDGSSSLTLTARLSFLRE
jgi:hypothetical protein